jgi:hypothetical protein
MSIINLNNYEAFLLDYMEGNLAAETIAELRIFAINHPELNIELDEQSELPVLDSSDYAYSGKKSLYKNEEEYLLNNRMIMHIEGLLSAEQSRELIQECAADPQVEKELSLYTSTVLEPEEITFPGKNSLKKKTRVISLFTKYETGMVAAAIIILVSGLLFLYNSSVNLNTSSTEISLNKPEVNPKSVSAVPVPGKSSGAADPVIERKKDLKNMISVPEPQHMLSEKIQETSPIQSFSDKEKVNEALTSVDSIIAPTLVKNFPDINIQDTAKNNVASYSEIVVEYDEEEMKEEKKENFWKKAVGIARQVNKLGVKSIDGEIEEDKTFRLSFNSFSVEKK